MLRYLVFVLLCATPMWAQRDFLTADEADQLREAESPDARLKLYVGYARMRLDLLGQLFAGQKPGRSGMIHDTLEDYTKIIEAIDTVTDDALSRKKPVTTMGNVAKSEREMLAKLEQFSKQDNKDIERYQFVLEQAINTTRDSVELSDMDINARSREAQETEQRITKEREAMSAPERKPDANAKAEGAPAKKKNSLLRKGEDALSDPRAKDSDSKKKAPKKDQDAQDPDTKKQDR